MLVVALTGLLLLLGSALGVVAAMVVAHRSAQAAADLAAVAGATALQRGRDPCGSAGDVAASNGASLTSCTVRGRDVLVDVTVPGPRWLGQDADLVGRARAGPATSTGAARRGTAGADTAGADTASASPAGAP